MPFEPFAISCSTCGAHLRVTNPALVGTIANCPKCGSLVQIAGSPGGDAGPPEVAGMAVGADPVDSEAITRDTVEPPETINSPTPGGGFAAPPEEPGTASRVPPSAIETSSPPAWQSARTERTRHIAMVVAIATCGLIVTSALFGWFVHSWNGRGQGLSIASVHDSAPAADDRDSATAADDSSEQHEPIPTSTQPEPARTETSEPTLPSSAEPTTTLDSATLDSAMPDEGSVEPGEGKTGGTPDVAADRQAEAEGSTVSDPGVSAPGVSAPGVSALGVSDPGASDPGASDPGGGTSSMIPADLLSTSPLSLPRTPVTPGVAVEERVPGEGMLDLPEGLKPFTRFLDFDPVAGETTDRLAPPPTLDQIELDAPAEEVVDPMLEANPLPRVNFERALAIEMAFASGGYPLSDFVLVIGQLTGLPIQLDWVSLDLVGIDLRGSVPISSEMSSAAEQLARAAAAVQAEVLREDAFLTISPSDDRFHVVADRMLDLDDFGDDRRSAAAVLKAFLGEPEGETAVRRGTTRPESQLSVLAVDALRRMRGMPGKIPDEAFSRWAMPVASVSPWRPIQGGDPGPALESSVSAAQLLRQTARRNQATCIVNWTDALRRKMSPDQRVMPYAGVDAATMLAEVLDPLALQLREVSPGYWWLGTEATYDRLPLLVWTEPLGEQRERVMRQLERAIGLVGGEAFPVAHDEASDRALILLPRFVVRQLPDILKP